MNRPYKEFRDKFLWTRIDYDKAFGYQCIDLIKLYLDICLWWWKVGALWNANQVPKNLEKKWFCKLDPKKTMIQWDIIVHTQWIYWHIAICQYIHWVCTIISHWIIVFFGSSLQNHFFSKFLGTWLAFHKAQTFHHHKHSSKYSFIRSTHW
jgi:hypothetical protein